MLYRRLDENWDYSFGRGRQNYISGLDAVGRRITICSLIKRSIFGSVQHRRHKN